MKLELDDPAFSLLKLQLGGELRKAADQVDQEDVEESVITLKIKVTKEEAFIPNREPAEKLQIAYKITRQITKKEEADGEVYELKDFEIGYDEDGNIELRRIYDPQHKIDEYL